MTFGRWLDGRGTGLGAQCRALGGGLTEALHFHDSLLPFLLGPQFSVKREELPPAVAALAGWHLQRLALSLLAVGFVKFQWHWVVT